jgi:hypothetical protein
MPKVAQELFLVGSIDVYQPGVVPIWKDKYDYDEFEKRRKISLSSIRKEFVKTSGNIWHHLTDYVSNNEILDSNGSWIKTDINVWKKAFSKMSLNHRYGEDSFSVKDINKSKGIMGYYSKDHPSFAKFTHRKRKKLSHAKYLSDLRIRCRTRSRGGCNGLHQPKLFCARSCALAAFRESSSA